MRGSSSLQTPLDTLQATFTRRTAMRSQGLTIFFIFFGIATLDALTSGRWVRIAFWLAMGAAFLAFDWWGSRRRDHVS